MSALTFDITGAKRPVDGWVGHLDNDERNTMGTMKPKAEWEQERKRVDESDSLQSVKFLAKKAQDERDQLLTAANVLGDIAVDGKQNELYAAVKALEAISIKALQIAEAVVAKMPNVK